MEEWRRIAYSAELLGRFAGEDLAPIRRQAGPGRAGPVRARIGPRRATRSQSDFVFHRRRVIYL